MSRITTNQSTVLGGNIPDGHAPNQPGEWQLRENEVGRRMSFGCPLRPGESCGVFVKPHAYEAAHGTITWTWDGNTTAPSLSPSINCIKNPPESYGCGWHGFLSGGAFR